MMSSEKSPDKPPLHTASSFPRMESPDARPFARTRARTVQSTVISDSDAPLPLSGDGEDQDGGPDLFEKGHASDLEPGDDEQQGDGGSALSRNVQEHPEELPIELMSLTDRYCGTSGLNL